VAKRVLLFVATNIPILLTVSISLRVLGALGFLDQFGDQGVLIVFCAVWGFGASFISLLISRWIAKRAMGVRLVDGHTGNADADWLHNTIANLSRQANLPMPEVGLYDSPEVNAFATGPSKKRSLVAVSTGLLRAMDRNEVEGVLAHEISHIANGDMVTMALLQGVVNAFVLYLSHVVAAIVRGALSGDRGGRSGGGGMISFLVYIVAQIFFGILARLSGSGNMIAALRRLQTTVARIDSSNKELATMKIAGGRSLMRLMATHPLLEVRIAALEGR